MENITGDGAVQLYHDNAEKLSTQSTGVLITGKMTATTLSVDDNADTAMEVLQVVSYKLVEMDIHFIALDNSNMNIYHNASGKV